MTATAEEAVEVEAVETDMDVDVDVDVDMAGNATVAADNNAAPMDANTTVTT